MHIPLFFRIPLRGRSRKVLAKAALAVMFAKASALVRAHQSERKLSGFSFIQPTLADTNLKTGGLPHIAQSFVTGFSILSFFFFHLDFKLLINKSENPLRQPEPILLVHVPRHVRTTPPATTASGACPASTGSLPEGLLGTASPAPALSP